jgi:hypothetical protein
MRAAPAGVAAESDYRFKLFARHRRPVSRIRPSASAVSVRTPSRTVAA